MGAFSTYRFVNTYIYNYINVYRNAHTNCYNLNKKLIGIQEGVCHIMPNRSKQKMQTIT